MDKRIVKFRKSSILIIAFVFIIFLFAGCEKKPYSLQHPTDDIAAIEIVFAKNSMDFTVVKTLSLSETEDFLAQLDMIQFESYYFGDPMSVSGDAVKITYQDGSYEMICHYWAEYVNNGNIYSIKRSCNKQEFENLISKFCISA